MAQEDLSAATGAHNYERIARAIDYIRANCDRQPSLEEVAAQANVSPFHFQRLFQSWAGVTPKKYLQFITLERTKSLLVKDQLRLFDVAERAGLSSPSRLHDLYVRMTPADYKRGGAGLTIRYTHQATAYGKAIIAATKRGICFLSFHEHASDALAALRGEFPAAVLLDRPTELTLLALRVLNGTESPTKPLALYLKGTPFQLKIWQALLAIPTGEVRTYGDVAKAIDQPGSARAAGTAIGKNPVAILIPCHRVIRADGGLGGYRWSEERKANILGREWGMTVRD
ncbi:bifunctional transcriptional activator/DNA repair enzyme AdaA [Neolewinella antarctica]|uniref:AraC family transcriptional regulator of adaptative response/methylated-DNA-[protein]-cysteine methyltransferase n=1 Tax=Neolewinella antarctica TaxID=442734 RepID=A0ABX0X9D7_9BACT|nr:methylated-DNA--[protein]-cysteine S-methyltransferase [Neolewinella antarctica]NJC25428.1 AraC family transcriptional regulator of adaptative response/methylated-DNA-[protein]-cysteine methyltransferase [Neolewinella antarctica]